MPQTSIIIIVEHVRSLMCDQAESSALFPFQESFLLAMDQPSDVL